MCPAVCAPHHRQSARPPDRAQPLGDPSAPTGPKQIWVADLTYVPTAVVWLYVAVIMDLYSRRIIG